MTVDERVVLRRVARLLQKLLIERYSHPGKGSFEKCVRYALDAQERKGGR